MNFFSFITVKSQAKTPGIQSVRKFPLKSLKTGRGGRIDLILNKNQCPETCRYLARTYFEHPAFQLVGVCSTRLGPYEIDKYKNRSQKSISLDPVNP